MLLYLQIISIWFLLLSRISELSSLDNLKYPSTMSSTLKSLSTMSYSSLATAQFSKFSKLSKFPQLRAMRTVPSSLITTRPYGARLRRIRSPELKVALDGNILSRKIDTSTINEASRNNILKFSSAVATSTRSKSTISTFDSAVISPPSPTRNNHFLAPRRSLSTESLNKLGRLPDLNGFGLMNKFRQTLESHVAQSGNKIKIALPELEIDERIKEAAENLKRTGLFNIDETITDLNEANKLLAEGKIDGVVAGAATSTGDVIRSAIKNIGLEEGCKTVSSFFLMEIPKSRNFRNEDNFDPSPEINDSVDSPATSFNSNVVLFSDCAVNPNPKANQLADIAAQAAGNWRFLFPEDEPVVAFLSFSTKGSAKTAETEKVLEAMNILKERNPNFLFDGELQLDAAIDRAILKKKTKNESPLLDTDKPVNCLVFPDLNSGNIAYKLVQRFAGANAIGPILQGLRFPSNDLSRGCSVQDIEDVAVITALQAVGAGR